MSADERTKVVRRAILRFGLFFCVLGYGPKSDLGWSGGGECSSDHLGLVHDLDDARKASNRFLGKLLVVVAGQAASQVEHAPVVALARESSNTEVARPLQPLPGRSGKFVRRSAFHRWRGDHWFPAEKQEVVESVVTS